MLSGTLQFHLCLTSGVPVTGQETMDLGPRASATMLSGMSGLSQFHNLDDDVAKETNDLTVESG